MEAIKIINAKSKLKELEKQSELLKAIAHPIRLCIVNGLLSEKGCNVTKIYGCLELPQSTVSQHLAKLKNAGIVEGRRNGLQVKYYVVNEDVIKIINSLNS